MLRRGVIARITRLNSPSIFFMPSDPLIIHSVSLPLVIDLGATFLFSITGAMVAVRRCYDPVGVFVLALASGLGGGLLRDGLFIQSGPPAALTMLSR